MAEQTKEKRNLFRLIADVPGLIVQLIQDEIESLKAELTTKLKGVAVGAILFAAAGSMAFFALFALLISAIFALATSGLPVWAAALIVAGGLLLFAAIFILIGVTQVKRGNPAKTAQSLKQDLNAIKGIGKRD